jgi:hypothetical protein
MSTQNPADILNITTQRSLGELMSKLRCELTKVLGSFENLPSCEYKFLSALSKGFEAFRPEALIGDRTRSVKDVLSNLVSEVAADFDSKVIPAAELTRSDYGGRIHANLRIDFIISCNCSSETPHVFGVELCLDNRIALGTNVLKASALAKIHPDSDTVFITLERGLLDSGGWDATYADTELYERDILSVYSELVSAEITLLSLGLVR